MREILFRGKRCDNGEWVQGSYIRAEHHWHNRGIHKDWVTLGASANGGWFVLHNKYAVKAETVGQFTGLTDKNGKKIFEGDVVESEFTKKLYTVCFGEYVYINEYEEEESAYGWYNADDVGVTTAFGCPENWAIVVGNIHDNPELLI